MKTLISLGMLLATLAHASAQGTLEFIGNLTPGQVVPPSGSTYSGSGSFQLEGTTWRYELLFGFPSPNFITTQIRGPAPMGSTGPVIFDLGEPGIAQPGPSDPGSLIYRGSFELTQNQITDLQSGLWYAEVYTAQFPNGDIRGQIAVVPEPSTIALLGIGGFILISLFMKTLKQRFSQWYNHQHGRKGTLWEERYKGVLVDP